MRIQKEIFLIPLSALYRLGLACHRAFYDGFFGRRTHFKIPTLSIGNLTWGGSGKTPLTIWLAEEIKKRGKTPAVLMRGYGNDEVKLYKAREILLAAGSNRVRAAQALLEDLKVQGMPCDAFLLDDGFQHWPVERESDIVCVNALDPFGNGHLIPAGPLRESKRALKRAEFVVITHADQVESSLLPVLENEIRAQNPLVKILFTEHTPTGVFNGRGVKETNIASMPYCLISGLGSPASFEKTVSRFMNRAPLKHFIFKDHHAFTPKEIEKILAESRALNAFCIVSEKDWARSEKLLGAHEDIKVLRVAMKFLKGEELLQTKLDKLFLERSWSATVLTDGKKGHEKQSLGLLEIFRRIFRDKKGVRGFAGDRIRVEYRSGLHKNIFWLLAPFFPARREMGFSFLKLFLKPETFAKLASLDTDFLILAGSSLHPVGVFLKRKFPLRVFVLMRPRGLYAFFPWDLVIQPAHDGRSRRANTLSTLLALGGKSAKELEVYAAAKADKFSLSGPEAVSLFVGGEAKDYQFSDQKFEEILKGLLRFSKKNSTPYFLTTSRRTPGRIIDLIEKTCGSDPLCKWLVVPTRREEPETVETMLSLSKVVLVTEESISMISEALSGGRRVVALETGKRPLGGKKKQFQETLVLEGLLVSARPEEVENSLERLIGEPIHSTNEELERIRERLGELL